MVRAIGAVIAAGQQGDDDDALAAELLTATDHLIVAAHLSGRGVSAIGVRRLLAGVNPAVVLRAEGVPPFRRAW